MFPNIVAAAATPFLLLLACSHRVSAEDVNSSSASPAGAVADAHSPMPTVDLGYSLYRPTAVNVCPSVSRQPRRFTPNGALEKFIG